MRKEDPAIRLARRVKKEGECLVFTGFRNECGYGMIGVGHKSVLAHRLAWELRNGPIPPGKSILHKCDNPPCVFPEHLYAGTQKDNMADAKNRGRLVTPPAGEKHWAAKLTRTKASEIQRLYALGNTSYSKLASEFDVSDSQIYWIVKGKRWA